MPRLRRAYWVYVQAYFAADPAEAEDRVPRLSPSAFPVANEFTEDTVDYMRARKAAILAQQGKVDHHG